MKASLLILGIAIGLSVASFSNWIPSADAAKAKWEYLCRIDTNITTKINELAGKGWELVTASANPPAGSAKLYCMKRPR